MTYLYWLNKLFQIFKKCIVDFPLNSVDKKHREENFVKFLLTYDVLMPPFPFIIKFIGWNLKDEKWEPGPFFLRAKKNEGTNEETNEDTTGKSLFALVLMRELLASRREIAIDPFQFMFSKIPRKPVWCVEIGDKEEVKVGLDEVGDIGLVRIIFNRKHISKIADSIKKEVYPRVEKLNFNETTNQKDDLQEIQIDNSGYQYYRFDYERVTEAGEKIKKCLGNNYKKIISKIIYQIKGLDFLKNLSESLKREIEKAAHLNNWRDVWGKIEEMSEDFIKSLFIPLVSYFFLNPGIKQLRYFVPGTWWDQDTHTASCGLLIIYDQEAFENFKNLEFETQTYSLKKLDWLCDQEKHPGITPQAFCMSDIFTHLYSQHFTIEKWIEKTKADFIKASIGSAVAAIMARNMSHNIGSHALWHLSNEALNSNFDSADMTSFFNYIRERMGFLGLISTIRPAWSVKMNLESLLNRFTKETVLLKNIVKSETEKGIKIELLGCDKDIEMPHGILGAQALYVIIENIIRNAVKHNPAEIANSSQSLEFIAELQEGEEKEWMDDYYRLSVSDNLGTAGENLIKQLNKNIDEDIINKDTGRLNSRNMGFKEMTISAGFLQMISPENFKTAKVPHLLKADRKNGNLSYTFHLRKPKEILVLSNKPLDKSMLEKLKNKGIFVETEDSFKDSFSKIMRKKLTHKLFIIDFSEMANNKDILERIANNRWCFPFRIFAVTNDIPGNQEIVSLNKTDVDLLLSNPEEGLKVIWKEWIEHYFDDRKDKKVLVIKSGIMDSIKSFLKEKIPPLEIVEEKNDCNRSGNIVLTHDIDIDESLNLYKDSYYLGGFSGWEENSLLLGEIIKEDGDIKLFYKLFESLLIRIAVIDERIWMASSKKITPLKYREETSVKEVWSKRQVYLLDHNTFINNFEEKFLKELEDIKPDILVIHQGVIDKWIDGYSEKFRDLEKRKSETAKLWKNKVLTIVNRVVIDSDRGRPPEVKEEEGVWLDFADLSRILVEESKNNLAKYHLVELLTSLREDWDE